MNKPLRVVVVDDTLTARQLMKHILIQGNEMQVVGEGGNGEQAVELVRDLKPDVLVMDIIMPRLDGLSATTRIMELSPLPIVLVSASLESHETDIAFRAIKAGALTLLRKPAGLQPDEMQQLRQTVQTMASVKVIRHYNRTELNGSRAEVPLMGHYEPQIVLIAASTGGPAALSEVLRGLPANFPLPVVIAQHISPDFIQSLITWLQLNSVLPVVAATDGVHPEPGNVYIAPAHAHLKIGRDQRFEIDPQLGDYRYVPSADVLFQTAAIAYQHHAIGVVLTGMGDDGAAGLRSLYNLGAATIAQDQATSVVYGMPHEAVIQGGARFVLPLSNIATTLVRLAKQGIRS